MTNIINLNGYKKKQKQQELSSAFNTVINQVLKEISNELKLDLFNKDGSLKKSSEIKDNA